MLGGNGCAGGGRKREWRPTGGESADETGGRGDAIEREMKKLRLAHDYDAARAAWGNSALGLVAAAAAAATDEPMDVEDEAAREDGDGDGDGDGDHNYSAKNSLLRECHYLRQLRRFQSERLRAGFFERWPGGMDAPAQHPPQPRF